MISETTAERLLELWGTWSCRKDDHGLGYPRKEPYAKAENEGGSGIRYDLFDIRLMDVDRAISGLKSDRRELFDTVWWWYVRGFPVSTVARLSGCSRATVYDRLQSVRRLIQETL